jgi:hypothetical protein
MLAFFHLCALWPILIQLRGLWTPKGVPLPNSDIIGVLLQIEA